MSHYHRCAGHCAPLFTTVTLRAMMGLALLQLTLLASAQTPPPLPFSSRPAEAPPILPDRGNVTILKLDDQLRVGQPIEDSKALTFTSSDSIDESIKLFSISLDSFKGVKPQRIFNNLFPKYAPAKALSTASKSSVSFSP